MAFRKRIRYALSGINAKIEKVSRGDVYVPLRLLNIPLRIARNKPMTVVQLAKCKLHKNTIK